MAVFNISRLFMLFIQPLLLSLQGLLSREDLHVNMCDALANLPTDLGIEAIETFSRRASSEPVRNKTGFMVRHLRWLCANLLICSRWLECCSMHMFAA